MTPFHWLDSATVSIAATNSGSDRAALLRMPTGETQVRVYNAGASVIFIKKGIDASVTATATDMPIAPGAIEVLTLTNNPTAPITHVAAYCATTGTLYITTGRGA
jgi:hypothetical protein